MAPKVFLLDCCYQTYDWGKVGKSSLVSRLLNSFNGDFFIKHNVCYAELWMGTHPKSPTYICHPPVSPSNLKEWIQSNPSCLGDKVRKAFNDELPFLFKVLSISKALSIQAHPNKNHAEVLHTRSPDLYPDSNHKPEMAIAISDFEGLCGFRVAKEIAQFLKDIPEFSAVVDTNTSKQFIEGVSSHKDEITLKQLLKRCFTSMMNQCEEVIAQQTELLISRIKTHPGTIPEEKLFCKLSNLFPNDVGCFSIYFLNHVYLKPGEALFLGPNEAHAYLYGDCVECMACSDNTVRAGLTPKFIDKDTLCEMLTYECASGSDKICKTHSVPNDSYRIVYESPVSDFTVDKVEIPNAMKYTLSPVESASIFIIIDGKAEANNESLGGVKLMLKPGAVCFISAGEVISLNVTSSPLLLFRAYSQV